MQITFVPRLRGTSGAVTGFGRMVEIGGAWAFEMQMSTDRLGARVLHWANMVQTREGDPSWQQVPGLTYSVPEMLDGAVYPRLDPAGRDHNLSRETGQRPCERSPWASAGELLDPERALAGTSARAMLRGSQVGGWLGDLLPGHAELKDMLSRAAGGMSPWRRGSGLLTTTVGAVASAVLVAVLGLFFAAQPRRCSGSSPTSGR